MTTTVASAPFPPAPVHAWRVFVAWLKLLLQVTAQYRLNITIWSIMNLLQVVVYLSVWRSVATSSGSQVGGYSAREFAGYFLVLLVIRTMIVSTVVHELGSRVRSGELSAALLRPAHPIFELFAGTNAGRAQSLLFVVPATIVLFGYYDASVDTTPLRVAATMLLVTLAMFTRYLIDASYALISFWVTRMEGLNGIYAMGILILGGHFAPISVLPGPVQDVAHALPFYWALGFPVEVLTGHAPLERVWVGALVLAAWGTMFWFIFRAGWRRGLRRYGAVGA